jgi:hypothetical protein
MMRMLALLSLLSVLIGCQQRTETPAGQPEQTVTSFEAVATDASTAVVDTVIPIAESRFFDSAAIGTQLGEDGAVAVEVTTVRRGGPIYATVRAKEVPAGLAARASWFAGKTKVAEETKPIPPDKRFVTFAPPDTKSWKPGDYTVELYVGGDEVAVKQLKVQK